MQLSRNISLSVYYFLSDLFSSTSIAVVDSYPVDELGVPTGEIQVPSVVPENSPMWLEPYQLGGPRLLNSGYVINIYALNPAQAEDISFFLLDALDTNIAVYDYSDGFPPDVVPTQIGALVIEGDIQSGTKYQFRGVNQKLYWRSIVDFLGYYSPKST